MAGLDPQSWTPRELRHSFVSLLSNNGGVSIEDISHLVGHASTVVTQKVYRKEELRPVLNVEEQPLDRQLARQVPDSDASEPADEPEEPR